MKVTRLLLLLAALPLLAARALAAQQVHGVVRDSATRQPIAGAVVLALDAAGRNLSRTITDEQGRYSTTLPPGVVRLQVVRIGFHPNDLAVQTLLTHGDAELDATMHPVPMMLDPVQSVAVTGCSEHADALQALQLWEQARAGLLASVVAQESHPAQVRILSYRRPLDGEGGKPLDQVVRARIGTSTRPFIAASTPDLFATRGYSATARGVQIFNSPDAEVLLDPTFVATHCFHVEQEDAEHRGQLGIAFAPMPRPGGDQLVDVLGVLWVDRANPALRTLAFKYTNLDKHLSAVGSLTFHTMRNGTVFISAWGITVSPQNIDGYQTGGEVAWALWSDGLRYDAPLGSVSGQVIQRKTHTPIAGAMVWLKGQQDSARTDATGHFTLDGILPGPYTLNAASDPALVAARIPQGPGARIVVDRQPLASAPLELAPNDTTAVNEACVSPRYANLPTIAMSLTAMDGWPSSGAKIDATWASGNTVGWRSEFTNLFGSALLCGLPHHQAIELRFWSGTADQLVKAVEISDDGLVHLIMLDAPATNRSSPRNP